MSMNRTNTRLYSYSTMTLVKVRGLSLFSDSVLYFLSSGDSCNSFVEPPAYPKSTMTLNSSQEITLIPTKSGVIQLQDLTQS